MSWCVALRRIAPLVAVLKSKDNGYDQYRKGQKKLFWVDPIGEEHGVDTKFLSKLKIICTAVNKTKHGKFSQKPKFYSAEIFVMVVLVRVGTGGGWGRKRGY